MNERIKLLKEQAMEWVPNMADPDTKIRLLNAEKFAELIVKECMNLVTYVGHSTRGFDCCGHVRFTNEKIKEHFGVES